MNNQLTPNILSFKPFAFHFNQQREKEFENARVRSRPRGFTAWISPSGKERLINLQISHCAYKDEVCKKTGVQSAKESFVLEINPRELPVFLAQAQIYCLPYFKDEKAEKYIARGYEFLWKYML